MKDLTVTLSLRQHGNACLMGDTPTHRLHIWLDPQTLQPVDSTVFKNAKSWAVRHRPTVKLVEQAQRDGDYGKAFEAVRKVIAEVEGTPLNRNPQLST